MQNNPPVNRVDPPAAAHKEMSFMEHLAELRVRLVYSAIAILVAGGFAFAFSSEIFQILSAPYSRAFSDNQLIGTGPAEAFMLRLKVSFFAGVILSCPVLFLQVWLFIAPGLYDNERRMALPFVLSSTLLFLLGAWFCYTAVLPFAFDFFADQYKAAGLTPVIRMTEHLSIIVQGLLGFGLVFEMPVLAFFLSRLGIINHHMLIKGSRYAIVIIFVVSAILTPPDAITQLLMAGPLLLLYGLSIVIARYSAKSA